MELKLIEQNDELTHVALAGELDSEGAAQIESAFMSCTRERKKPTIVDLSQVKFLGSPGIRMLLVGEGGLKRAGAKMVLLNPQQLVEDTLKVAKLDRIFHIVHGADEARSALEGN